MAMEYLQSYVAPIARVCHEVNRAYCASLGDTSQQSWFAAPSWQRTSAMNGVRFALDNPDASPAAQHEQWMADKLADGWAWGHEKDVALKTHPCLVPYEKLPHEQRVKDELFIAVVRAMR
jgi:hypothetical protein